VWNIHINRCNVWWKIKNVCRPKGLSGYLERITLCFWQEFENNYIKRSLNTAQVYKTHNHNLSHILKAHYTVTYVMTNAVFPLLCVSSADVNLWVNGGWDQPNCGVTLNPEFLLLFLQNLNIQGNICNFLSFVVL